MSCYIDSMMSKRGWTDDIKNTGKSFKNWDSCMNDKPCKIIAIVGICLAVVLGLWLLGALLTCIRQGVTGIGGFICWCCSSPRRSANGNNGGQQYLPQHSMNAAPNVVYQPVQPPEHNAYYHDGNNQYGNNSGNPPEYYSESRYNKNKNSNDVFELEQNFDLEGQKLKSQRKAKTKDGNSPYPNDEFFY